LLSNFSLTSCGAYLTESKCKDDDNRELDLFEFYKFINMVLVVLTEASFFLALYGVANPWIVMHFFKMFLFGITLSCNLAVESFPFIGAFFGAYQCFKILKKKNRKYFKFSEIMLLYFRKFLRIAPIYYLLLFLGWSSCSRISDGPMWPYTGAMWSTCPSTWWAQLLFVGNLYGYQDPSYGCFYWSWGVQCELQLYLLVPFLVMVYTVLGTKPGHFTMFIIAFAVAPAISISLVKEYNLRAGYFAIENYDLMDKIFTKPWTKLGSTASGVWFAHLYHSILEYR